MTTTEYWTHRNGQTEGPFDHDVIVNLEDPEVLVSHGKDWARMREHPDFSLSESTTSRIGKKKIATVGCLLAGCLVPIGALIVFLIIGIGVSGLEDEQKSAKVPTSAVESPVAPERTQRETLERPKTKLDPYFFEVVITGNRGSRVSCFLNGLAANIEITRDGMTEKYKHILTPRIKNLRLDSGNRRASILLPRKFEFRVQNISRYCSLHVEVNNGEEIVFQETVGYSEYIHVSD